MSCWSSGHVDAKGCGRRSGVWEDDGVGMAGNSDNETSPAGGRRGAEEGLFEIRLECRRRQGGDYYSSAEAPSEPGWMDAWGAEANRGGPQCSRPLQPAASGGGLNRCAARYDVAAGVVGAFGTAAEGDSGSPRFGSRLRKPTGVGAQAENRIGTRAAASTGHGYWLPNERVVRPSLSFAGGGPQITLEPARPCDGEHVWRSTCRLIWSLFVVFSCPVFVSLSSFAVAGYFLQAIESNGLELSAMSRQDGPDGIERCTISCDRPTIQAQ